MIINLEDFFLNRPTEAVPCVLIFVFDHLAIPNDPQTLNPAQPRLDSTKKLIHILQ